MSVDYPYLPSDRTFRFTSLDDPFMLAAKQAQETYSGDPLFPVGAVLVKDGQVVAMAGNGFNRGSGTVHVCPRVVLDCPSGTGYELCHLHDSPGHAEPMLMHVATEQGIDSAGADVYLYGHWWCCEPCWKAMIDGGVRDVYLLENADVEFSRENVYTRTLQPTKTAPYVLIQDQALRDVLVEVCDDLGGQLVDEFEKADVVIVDVSFFNIEFTTKPVVLVAKKNELVVEHVRLHPKVVSVIEYELMDDAAKQLRNVLRQL